MRELIKYAEEEDLVCVVNQQYRWMQRNQDIHDALHSGKIGELGWVRSNFTQNKYHFNSWWRAMHEDISQYNWYIHHYDTMRFYLGSNPKKVRAKLIRVPWSKIYGESTIFLNVTFENGVEWSYVATQEGVGGYEDSGQTSISFYGSKGSIRNTKETPPELRIDKGNPHKPEVSFIGEIRPEDMIDTDSSSADGVDKGPKYPPGWETTMQYFIDAVRSEGEKPHPTRFQDNLFTVAIPLCARESHRRGGVEIDVKEYLGMEQYN